MKDLKPCPFCGRRPSKVKEHYITDTTLIYYSVACKAPLSRCGVNPNTRWMKTREEAIEAWNRRAHE